MLYLIALSLLTQISHANAPESPLVKCGVQNPQCRATSPNCASAYTCEKAFLRKISRAWYWHKAFGTKEALEACTEAYENQKYMIEALDTTIECTDNPHFGG